MTKIYNNLVIVLLAGGVGNRLHKQTSKQLIYYDNETILEKNIIRFQKYIKNVPIQVVSNEKDITKVSEINKKHNILLPVLGGKERHESVYNALVTIEKFNPKYVLIHDAARPLISSDVIDRLLEYCDKNIACVVP